MFVFLIFQPAEKKILPRVLRAVHGVDEQGGARPVAEHLGVGGANHPLVHVQVVVQRRLHGDRVHDRVEPAVLVDRADEAQVPADPQLE